MSDMANRRSMNNKGDMVQIGKKSEMRASPMHQPAWEHAAPTLSFLTSRVSTLQSLFRGMTAGFRVGRREADSPTLGEDRLETPLRTGLNPTVSFSA